MEISYLLARVMGLVFLVTYSGVLINYQYYRRTWREIAKQPLILFLSGFIALLLGLLIIQVHNIWRADWRALVTFLGWLMFAQGIFRIVFPETVLRITQSVIEKKTFLIASCAVMLLIGIYLVFKGFGF